MKRILMTLLIVVCTIFITCAQNTPSLWTHKSNTGGNDFMISDLNQNIYVFDNGSQGQTAPNVIKLSSGGGVVYSTSYLPAGYSSMDLNSCNYYLGNLYIGSTVSGPSGNSRLCLTKTDAATGAMLSQIVVDSVYANTWMNLQNREYYAFQLSIDAGNYLHVSFIKTDSAFNNYICFLKFDLNFNLVSSFSYPLNPVDTWGQVEFANDGSAYFTYTEHIVKLKSDYSGLAWVDSLTNDPYAFPKCLSVNSSGEIVAVFQDYGNGTGTRVVKLLDNGSSFSQIYDVPTYGNNSLELNKMVFSAGDNAIYLAGTINSTTTYNWFVYKLNATTGAIEWSDSAFNSLGVSKLLVSPTGNVIVAGGGENYYLWFYNSTGNVDRVFVYDGACQANDMISDALLVGTGAIVVTGYACENSNTIAYGTTIKYNYPTITTGFPAVESLSGTLFPNPSGDRVFIIGTLQIRNVQAVDQFGKLINLPFEGNLINVGSLSNGIYVLTILSDEGAMSEKLLIEK